LPEKTAHLQKKMAHLLVKMANVRRLKKLYIFFVKIRQKKPVFPKKNRRKKTKLRPIT